MPLGCAPTGLSTKTRARHLEVLLVHMSDLDRGWAPCKKHKFLDFYKRMDALSVTQDGILAMSGRIMIPSTSRKTVLDDLH